MDKRKINAPLWFIEKCLTINQIWFINTRFEIINEFTKRRENECTMKIISDLSNYYNISFSSIFRIVYNKSLKNEN